MTSPVSPSVIRPRSSFDQRVEVETPEQVVFSYTVAGVGSRAAAALIDYGIVLAALLAVWMLLSLIADAVASVSGTGRAAVRISGSWAVAVMVLVQFIV